MRRSSAIASATPQEWLRLRVLSPPVLRLFGWALVLWIVLFWRLGYPSFWDPDEAHYAQTSREMLANHDWLVPTFDGQAFFDKPVLFHWLQMFFFSILGANELAARLVPALAALGLIGCTAWLGVELFSADVGELGALMLAVLPATFALSAYGILDMLFTALMFGGAALLAVAALKDRHRLEAPAYGLIALAVLTKGPLALALVGLAFGLSLVLAPEIRPKLLALRWRSGLLAVLCCSLPWFLWMWIRFDGAFIEGYVLRENVWLFARSLYRHQYSRLVYFRILLVGLLPWTPILMGRVFDGFRGHRFSSEERLLAAWGIAIAGFFMASHFRLDHYLYPVAPAWCLLAAAAWHRARTDAPTKRHVGVWVGSLAAMATVGIAGILFAVWFERVPVDLSSSAQVAAVGLVAGSCVSIGAVFLQKLRLPRIPASMLAGILLLYACAIMEGFPAFERAKPVRELAGWIRDHGRPEDRVASFGITRWSNSWRFYVNRPSPVLDTPEQVHRFFSAPGVGYCLMLEQDYEQFLNEGLPLKVVYQREGLFTTTGRALRRAAGRRSGWRRFIIVTTDETLRK